MKLDFDPEKSLFELSIVRITAIATIIAAIIISVTIIYNSNLTADFSDAGFNAAAVTFKIPLAVLAVGLTLIGIFGANHRSEQTRKQILRNAEQIALTTKQISSTESQNRFSNHYKHIEEFGKFATDEKYNVKITSTRELYSKLFPNSHLGEFSVSTEAINNLNQFAFFVLTMFGKMEQDDSIETQRAIASLIKRQKEVLSDFFLSTSAETYTGLRIDGEEISAPGGTVNYLIIQLIGTCKRIDGLLTFDLNYRRSPAVNLIRNAKPDGSYGSNYYSTFKTGVKLEKVFGSIQTSGLSASEISLITAKKPIDLAAT